jgi:hypothetical protein
MTSRDFIIGMTNNADIQQERRELAGTDNEQTVIWDDITEALAVKKWNKLMETLTQVILEHVDDEEVVDEAEAYFIKALGIKDIKDNNLPILDDVYRKLWERRTEIIVLRNLLQAGGFNLE